MITRHPAAAAIQQYALDKTGCEPGVAAHIEACDECLAAVASYRVLFAEIKQQPAPAFDFDLAGLVMPQLVAESKPRLSWLALFPYGMAVVAAGAIGTVLYLFRKELLFLFTGTMPIVMYLIVLTTTIILLFQGIGMYKKYQQQMNSLNSH
jgi:hypothetical protein